jgi:putative glutamine amidotransferase
MKPVLAVCPSPGHGSTDYSRPYEEALRAVGVETLLVRGGDKIPSEFAGLVLLGGSDVNPALYREMRQSETDTSDDARDRLECELIQQALDRDVPLLAICRGLQILNVHHGGTLIQHLKNAGHHQRRTPDRGLPAHRVEIFSGTKLAEIAAGASSWEVNSRHHQAIDRVGNKLRVSARDPEDGTIEAVERPDKWFVIGVQWHPENQFVSDVRQASLFHKFAAAL